MLSQESEVLLPFNAANYPNFFSSINSEKIKSYNIDLKKEQETINSLIKSTEPITLSPKFLQQVLTKYFSIKQFKLLQLCDYIIRSNIILVLRKNKLVFLSNGVFPKEIESFIPDEGYEAIFLNGTDHHNELINEDLLLISKYIILDNSFANIIGGSLDISILYSFPRYIDKYHDGLIHTRIYIPLIQLIRKELWWSGESFVQGENNDELEWWILVDNRSHILSLNGSINNRKYINVLLKILIKRDKESLYTVNILSQSELKDLKVICNRYNINDPDIIITAGFDKPYWTLTSQKIQRISAEILHDKTKYVKKGKLYLYSSSEYKFEEFKLDVDKVFSDRIEPHHISCIKDKLHSIIKLNNYTYLYDLKKSKKEKRITPPIPFKRLPGIEFYHFKDNIFRDELIDYNIREKNVEIMNFDKFCNTIEENISLEIPNQVHFNNLDSRMENKICDIKINNSLTLIENTNKLTKYIKPPIQITKCKHAYVDTPTDFKSMLMIKNKGKVPFTFNSWEKNDLMYLQNYIYGELNKVYFKEVDGQKLNTIITKYRDNKSLKFKDVKTENLNDFILYCDDFFNNIEQDKKNKKIKEKLDSNYKRLENINYTQISYPEKNEELLISFRIIRYPSIDKESIHNTKNIEKKEGRVKTGNHYLRLPDNIALPILYNDKMEHMYYTNELEYKTENYELLFPRKHLIPKHQKYDLYNNTLLDAETTKEPGNDYLSILIKRRLEERYLEVTQIKTKLIERKENSSNNRKNLIINYSKENYLQTCLITLLGSSYKEIKNLMDCYESNQDTTKLFNIIRDLYYKLKNDRLTMMNLLQSVLEKKIHLNSKNSEQILLYFREKDLRIDYNLLIILKSDQKEDYLVKYLLEIYKLSYASFQIWTTETLFEMNKNLDARYIVTWLTKSLQVDSGTISYKNNLINNLASQDIKLGIDQTITGLNTEIKSEKNETISNLSNTYNTITKILTLINSETQLIYNNIIEFLFNSKNIIITQNCDNNESSNITKIQHALVKLTLSYNQCKDYERENHIGILDEDGEYTKTVIHEDYKEKLFSELGSIYWQDIPDSKTKKKIKLHNLILNIQVLPNGFSKIEINIANECLVFIFNKSWVYYQFGSQQNFCTIEDLFMIDNICNAWCSLITSFKEDKELKIAIDYFDWCLNNIEDKPTLVKYVSNIETLGNFTIDNKEYIGTSSTFLENNSTKSPLIDNYIDFLELETGIDKDIFPVTFPAITMSDYRILDEKEYDDNLFKFLEKNDDNQPIVMEDLLEGEDSFFNQFLENQYDYGTTKSGNISKTNYGTFKIVDKIKNINYISSDHQVALKIGRLKNKKIFEMYKKRLNFIEGTYEEYCKIISDKKYRYHNILENKIIITNKFNYALLVEDLTNYYKDSLMYTWKSNVRIQKLKLLNYFLYKQDLSKIVLLSSSSKPAIYMQDSLDASLKRTTNRGQRQNIADEREVLRQIYTYRRTRILQQIKDGSNINIITFPGGESLESCIRYASKYKDPKIEPNVYKTLMNLELYKHIWPGQSMDESEKQTFEKLMVNKASTKSLYNQYDSNSENTVLGVLSEPDLDFDELINSICFDKYMDGRDINLINAQEMVRYMNNLARIVANKTNLHFFKNSDGITFKYLFKSNMTNWIARFYPKELEQKVYRLFCIASILVKGALSVGSKMFKDSNDEIPGELLLLPTNDRLLGIQSISIAQTRSSESTSIVRADVSGHNQSENPFNMLPLLREVERWYGIEVPKLVPLSFLFSNLILLYEDKKYGISYVSRNLFGSIEGWINALWCLQTQMILTEMHEKLPVEIIDIYSYSDDIVILLKLKNISPDLYLKEFKLSFSRRGFIAKPSQTALSNKLMIMLKVAIIYGLAQTLYIKNIMSFSINSSEMFFSVQQNFDGINSSYTSALDKMAPKLFITKYKYFRSLHIMIYHFLNFLLITRRYGHKNLETLTPIINKYSNLMTEQERISYIIKYENTIITLLDQINYEHNNLATYLLLIVNNFPYTNYGGGGMLSSSASISGNSSSESRRIADLNQIYIYLPQEWKINIKRYLSDYFPIENNQVFEKMLPFKSIRNHPTLELRSIIEKGVLLRHRNEKNGGTTPPVKNENTIKNKSVFYTINVLNSRLLNIKKKNPTISNELYYTILEHINEIKDKVENDKKYVINNLTYWNYKIMATIKELFLTTHLDSLLDKMMSNKSCINSLNLELLISYYLSTKNNKIFLMAQKSPSYYNLLQDLSESSLFNFVMKVSNHSYLPVFELNCTELVEFCSDNEADAYISIENKVFNPKYNIVSEFKIKEEQLMTNYLSVEHQQKEGWIISKFELNDEIHPHTPESRKGIYYKFKHIVNAAIFKNINLVKWAEFECLNSEEQIGLQNIRPNWKNMIENLIYTFSNLDVNTAIDVCESPNKGHAIHRLDGEGIKSSANLKTHLNYMPCISTTLLPERLIEKFGPNHNINIDLFVSRLKNAIIDLLMFTDFEVPENRLLPIKFTKNAYNIVKDVTQPYWELEKIDYNKKYEKIEEFIIPDDEIFRKIGAASQLLYKNKSDYQINNQVYLHNLKNPILKNSSLSKLEQNEIFNLYIVLKEYAKENHYLSVLDLPFDILTKYQDIFHLKTDLNKLIPTFIEFESYYKDNAFDKSKYEQYINWISNTIFMKYGYDKRIISFIIDNIVSFQVVTLSGRRILKIHKVATGNKLLSVISNFSQEITDKINYNILTGYAIMQLSDLKECLTLEVISKILAAILELNDSEIILEIPQRIRIKPDPKVLPLKILEKPDKYPVYNYYLLRNVNTINFHKLRLFSEALAYQNTVYMDSRFNESPTNSEVFLSAFGVLLLLINLIGLKNMKVGDATGGRGDFHLALFLLGILHSSLRRPDNYTDTLHFDEMLTTDSKFDLTSEDMWKKLLIFDLIILDISFCKNSLSNLLTQLLNNNKHILLRINNSPIEDFILPMCVQTNYNIFFLYPENSQSKYYYVLFWYDETISKFYNNSKSIIKAKNYKQEFFIKLHLRENYLNENDANINIIDADTLILKLFKESVNIREDKDREIKIYESDKLNIGFNLISQITYYYILKNQAIIYKQYRSKLKEGSFLIVYSGKLNELPLDSEKFIIDYISKLLKDEIVIMMISRKDNNLLDYLVKIEYQDIVFIIPMIKGSTSDILVKNPIYNNIDSYMSTKELYLFHRNQFKCIYQKRPKSTSLILENNKIEVYRYKDNISLIKPKINDRIIATYNELYSYLIELTNYYKELMPLTNWTVNELKFITLRFIIKTRSLDPNINLISLDYSTKSDFLLTNELFNISLYSNLISPIPLYDIVYHQTTNSELAILYTYLNIIEFNENNFNDNDNIIISPINKNEEIIINNTIKRVSDLYKDVSPEIFYDDLISSFKLIFRNQIDLFLSVGKDIIKIMIIYFKMKRADINNNLISINSGIHSMNYSDICLIHKLRYKNKLYHELNGISNLIYNNSNLLLENYRMEELLREEYNEAEIGANTLKQMEYANAVFINNLANYQKELESGVLQNVEEDYNKYIKSELLINKIIAESKHEKEEIDNLNGKTKESIELSILEEGYISSMKEMSKEFQGIDSIISEYPNERDRLYQLQMDLYDFLDYPTEKLSKELEILLEEMIEVTNGKVFVDDAFLDTFENYVSEKKEKYIQYAKPYLEIRKNQAEFN